MFWKKTPEPVPTFADCKSHRLLIQYYDCGRYLEEVARDTLVEIAVVDLYPEGPDKEAAKEEAEAARRILLNAIGGYDGARAEYLKFRSEYQGKFVTTVGYQTKLMTSHERIKNVYKEFYGGNK